MGFGSLGGLTGGGWKHIAGSVAAKVGAKGNPYAAIAGAAYDYYNRGGGGTGSPGHPQPEFNDGGDPTKKQQRALDRYSLYSTLDKPGKMAKWEGKANKFNIQGDLGALADKYGSPEDALTRMASQGAIGGRRAARYESQLGEKYMEDAAGIAKTRAQDSIGYGADNLERNLRAMGVMVDPSSPAYQALAARYMGTRQDASVAANNQIDLQLAAAKAAARAGALSPQALIDIGDTVYAMDQLKKQESMFQQMQRGAMYSSFINPLNALGAGVGGAAGGSQGAFAGGPSLMGGVGQLSQLFSMFSGLGGGGGGGTTPGVSPVQGLQTQWGSGGLQSPYPGY